MPTASGTANKQLPPPLSPAVAWCVIVVTFALAGVVVVIRESPLAPVVLAAMGVATTVAIVVGRRRNRPGDRLPWTFMALSTGLFIVSLVLRYLLIGTAAAPVAEVISVTAYGAMVMCFLMFLRARGAVRRSLDELVDGLIVVASAAALVIVVFTVPTAVNAGRLSASALLGLYPLADVAILFLVLLLSWTTVRRVPAYWLLAAGMAGMFVGDVGYSILAKTGQQLGSSLLDLPFVFSFGCLAAASLHPSMAQLSSKRSWPVQAWSRWRLALLVPALLVPAGIGVSGTSRASTVVGAAGCAVVTVLLLVRAVGAVQAQGRAQRGLRHQAAHDSLTGLTNRAELVDEVTSLLDRAAVSGGHVDVLFLDLDGFKLVNDSRGHAAGDQVLKAAAQRLRRVSLPGDVVARPGGDEFVLARHVARHDPRDGRALSRLVIGAFGQALSEVEGAPRTTVSVGLARSTPSSTADDLLRDGDTAMHRAKAEGRNRCVVFDESMRAAVLLRTRTELALRGAAERGELHLVFQPVMGLDDGMAVGVEALVRWKHPTWGLVSPDAFIPLAEQTGLIIEIGSWVLEEACAQAAAWARSSRDLPPLHMAINISARQLAEGSGLVDLVSRTIRDHGLDPRTLMLEVTESALMDDAESALEVLTELKGLGVRLAVDDFGTGYSSLAYLQRFPVDRLKIDQSFVRGLGRSAGDRAIVRSVVELARAFDVDTVAEGVETAEQLAQLRQLGCGLGQGYLWSPGRTAVEVEAVLPYPWLDPSATPWRRPEPLSARAAAATAGAMRPTPFANWPDTAVLR